MKLNLRAICFTSSLAVIMSLAGAANADVINGGVYNTPAFPAPLGPHGPRTAAIATFVVSDINFFAPLTTPASPAYTVAGFLNSNGHLNTLFPVAVGTQSLDNKAFEFVGQTVLTSGTVYTVTHDDGVFLYLNDSSTCTICAGEPTAASSNSFTVATTGVYNFDLWYAEVNGAPATLNAPFAATPKPPIVPEPSSLLLLGTGLVGAAGMLRRRLFS